MQIFTFLCNVFDIHECPLKSVFSQLRMISFDALFSSFSLAESPPRNLQVTATNNGVLTLITV